MTMKSKDSDSNLDWYFGVIKRNPLLSREEERELAEQFSETGDEAVAHKLVASNLRFVVKLAHEYKGYGLNITDIIQEGNDNDAVVNINSTVASDGNDINIAQNGDLNALDILVDVIITRLILFKVVMKT